MSTELPIKLSEDDTDLLIQLLIEYDENHDLSHSAWAKVHELTEKLDNLLDRF